MSSEVSLDYILNLVQPLDRETKRLLADQIQAMVSAEDEISAQQNDTWTEEELAELIQPDPMTGKEIVAAGLTGTWTHLGDVDTIDWINEQKAKRRRRNQW